MKLTALHEDGGVKLQRALRFIYGHNGRPTGAARPKLHQPLKAAPVDRSNRALDDRSSDPGTPWKLRYRKFFRMDAGEGGTPSS